MPESARQPLEIITKRPVVIAACAFGAGSALARWWAAGPWVLLAAAAILALATLALVLKRLRPAALVSAALLFSTLGLWAGARALHPLVHFDDHILAYLDKKVVIKCRVASDPKEWARGLKFDLDVLKVVADERERPARGGVVLYLKGTWNLGPGDRIDARVRLKPFLSRRNPGGFDYPLYMASRSLYGSAFPAGKRAVLKTHSASSPLLRARALLRARFSALLDALPAKREASLIRALTLGDKREVPQELLRAFNSTGTRHLLAISGLHLGIVAALAFCLSSLVFVRVRAISLRYGAYKPAAVASLVAAAFYAWLTPLGIPTARALIMLAVGVAAALLDRLKDLASVLALAGLLLLAFFPASIFTPSFQLSFSAVAGIGLYAWGRRGREKRNLLLEGAFVSLAASVATFPLVAYHFHLFSPAAFALNVVLVPLVGFLVVPLSLAALVLAPLSAKLAFAPLFLASHLLGPGVDAIILVSQSPLRGLTLPPPAAWQVLFVYAALFFIFVSRSKRARIIAGLALVPILVLPPIARAALPSSAGLFVTALDVGAGSSSVVRLPGGRVMVVDAGPRKAGFDAGQRIVAPALRSLGVTKIHHLVLSQAWPGLMGGMAALVKEFYVGEFWFHGPAGLLPQDLLLSLKERAVPVVRPRRIEARGATVLPLAGGPGEPLRLLLSYHKKKILLAHGGIVGRRMEPVDALIAPAPAYTPREELIALAPGFAAYTFKVSGAEARRFIKDAGLASTRPLTTLASGAITFRVDEQGRVTAKSSLGSFWRPLGPKGRKGVPDAGS